MLLPEVMHKSFIWAAHGCTCSPVETSADTQNTHLTVNRQQSGHKEADRECLPIIQARPVEAAGA